MNELNRTLTPLRGAALMLNIVVGAGLLALPGLVVEMAGDHALWSWLVCAVASLPLLTVFIIMGRRYPHAGGIAHFARMAFGKAGFIIGSLIFLGAVAFGLPAIALTGGYYIAEVFGGSPTAYAAGIIVAAAASHLVSSDVAGRISTFIASAILLTLIGLLVIGAYGIDWTTIETRTVPFSDTSVKTAMLPFMMIFFAFTGWEVAAGLSEEFREPARDFPRAMFLSFIAATALYIAMAFVVQNSISAVTPEAAFVSIAGQAFGKYGSLSMSLIAATIIFANLLGAIWAVSRMVYSLGREGYLPFKLTVSPAGVPVTSVMIVAGVILAVLIGDRLQLLNIRDMLALAGQNFMILYGIGGIALFRLSPDRIEQAIAAVATALAITLTILEGPSLAYPIGLALAGWLIFRLKVRLDPDASADER
jgi:amino acid efflux transporter